MAKTIAKQNPKSDSIGVRPPFNAFAKATKAKTKTKPKAPAEKLKNNRFPFVHWSRFFLRIISAGEFMTVGLVC